MQWVSKNTYLTQSEMENNAQIIYGIFNSLGYNFSTICAILGNMQQESTLSPIFGERGGGGYGLLQWTPKSDLTDACRKLGLSPYTDGTVQCNCLDGELFKLGGQWYSTQAYINNYKRSGASDDMVGLTPEQFKLNTKNKGVNWMTIAFMTCYERPSLDPGTNYIDKRKKYANNWYQFLSGVTPPPEPPTPGGGGDVWKKIWFLYAGTDDFRKGR